MRSTTWGPIALALLVGTALAACGSGGDQTGPTGGATPTAAATPRPSPPPVPAAASCQGPDQVQVQDADSLRRALAAAVPGQVIVLADGRYQGSFTAKAQGMAEQPIRVCGSRAAVLDGGGTDAGYTVHLDGAAHWQLSGFTVTGGQKGVVVDGGNHDRIDGLLVTGTGDEGIHLRRNSTDDVVTGTTVRDTGRRTARFGEGIYVGSAHSNWCEVSGCQPDRSDRAVLDGNTVSGTTAEAVDIKEGTSDGVLRGNRFDGAGMSAADSWVDVKGNGWTVVGNTGTRSSADGFQVHQVVDGWGLGNAFSQNTVSGVPGFVVNAAGPRALRTSTMVTCASGAGAGRGLTNVTCRS